MPDASVENRLSWDNIPFATSKTVPADGVNRKEYTAPAAKTGSLSTRTSNTVGTITGVSGHGINTGNTISLGWQNLDGTYGSQTNVTVGTVSGLSIPISGGVLGDNLPLQDTAVTFQVPHAEAIVFEGDDAQYSGAKCTRQGTIEVLDSDDNIVLAVPGLNTAVGNGYQWYTGSVTNPFAAVAIAMVRFANLDSVYTNNLVFGAGYN